MKLKSIPNEKIRINETNHFNFLLKHLKEKSPLKLIKYPLDNIMLSNKTKKPKKSNISNKSNTSIESHNTKISNKILNRVEIKPIKCFGDSISMKQSTFFSDNSNMLLKSQIQPPRSRNRLREVNFNFTTMNHFFKSENNYGINTKVLFRENKIYRNQSEFAILNKKPDIGYVRSILSRNSNKNEEIINFFDKENYDFNIEQKYIDRYKENQKNLNFLKENESDKLPKIKTEKDLIINLNIKPLKSTTSAKNSFNENELITSKEDYYRKLDRYKHIIDLKDNSDFKFKRNITNTKSSTTVNNFSEKSRIKIKRNCISLKNLDIYDTRKRLNNDNLSLDIINDNINMIKQIKNSPNIKNLKRIEILKNSTNVQSLLKLNNWEKEDDYKKYVIEKFLSKFNEKDFISDKIRYRKIYVIIDGINILNHDSIPGKFIDIPTKRVSLKYFIISKFYTNNVTSKERIVVLNNFINDCIKRLNVKIIKSIFLNDCSAIFDLQHIPEKEKYIFISDSTIMKGMRIIFNKNKHNILNSYHKLKQPVESCKNMSYIKRIRQMKNKIYLVKDFEIQHKKFKQRKRNFNSNTCHNYSLSKSFNLVNEEDEEWMYISEDESNKKMSLYNLNKKFKNKYELYIHFTQFEIEHILLKKKLNKFRDHNNINALNDLENLINKYNSELQSKSLKENKILNLKKNKFSKKEKKNDLTTKDIETKHKDEITKNAHLFMKKFLENLQLFKVQKDENFEEMLIKYKSNKSDLKFLNMNRRKYENIYYKLDRIVNKYIPNLFSYNIPKLLKLYPNYDRKELFEIFIQYKVLLKICVAVNRCNKLAQSGVDFNTFWKGVPQISSENADLAMKFFKVMNKRKSSYLSLDEFLQGMSVFKSQNLSGKIDIFFKIIDTDGNGRLSYEEVYEISLMSLQRTVVDDNPDSNEIVTELATFFANLIFSLVEIDIQDEIPLDIIKEKIVEGGQEASYLEMFCCTDGFRKFDNISFLEK